MFKKVFISVLFIIFGANAAADQVIFKNGDKISGTIEKLTDGKLVIESDVAGTITVDMSRVKNLETSKPVKLYLPDAEPVTARIEPAGADGSIVNIVSDDNSDTLNLGDIGAINPPEIKYPQWSGEITAGYTSKQGNTKSTDMNVDMKLKRHTKTHDLIVTGEHSFSQKIDKDTDEKITSEDSWLLKAKDQFKLTNGFYGYLEASYERDRIANLDRRIIEGLGVGQKWIDSDKTHFQTDIGLANIDERYTDSTSNNSVAGQMGYCFDHKINGSVSFVHDTMYYPGFDEQGDYYLKSNAELRFKVTKNLFTNFKVVYEYDNQPADDSESTDTKYIFGVGYKF